jgi:hypothetical protein
MFLNRLVRKERAEGRKLKVESYTSAMTMPQIQFRQTQSN